MAIDDNTSYELTGYQVKDLAQKIRAKADSNSLASVATSGLYSDLTGAPTIPTVYNGTLTIQQNGTTVGTFSANQSTDETIDIVPKLVEMSYGESNAWAKFIAAYNAGSIVYCRASSNANPASGSQTRKAFMAYVNNATSPTSVEFQYVRSVSSKSSSQPVDQVFVYTLTNASGGTWSVATRDMAPKLAAGTNTSVSYASGTYTVSANVPVLNYSTSEVDTGTTWIDGSHIYKKTIDTGTLPNSGRKNVAHNISNLGTVIKIEGYAKQAQTSDCMPLPFTTPYETACIAVVVENAANIVIQTRSDRSDFTESYITLYYTKSS